MFGGDGSVEGVHDVVHDPVEGLPQGQEGGPVHADRLAQVEVDVAVAEMPEGADAQARQRSLAGSRGPVEEFGQARERHRDVVLDRAALGLLDLGQALAQVPEIASLRLARRKGGIPDPVFAMRPGEHRRQEFAGVLVGPRGGDLHQGIGPVAARQGRPGPGAMAQDDLQPEGHHVLEGGERRPGLVPQRPEQAERGLGGGEAHEGHRARQGARVELQHRRRDESQGALGAEEEVLEVVARIVLAQALEPVPDPAVGQHHLEPEDEVAGIAVGEHRRAARVGGEVATDAARALGGQREREQHPGGLRRRLHLAEHHAGLHGDAGIHRIDRAQARQPRHGDDDAPLRQAPADMAGITSLRHHGHARLGAGPHREGDLGGVGRPHHREGVAPAQAPRLRKVGSEVGGIREDMGAPESLGETGQKGGCVGHEGVSRGRWGPAGMARPGPAPMIGEVVRPVQGEERGAPPHPPSVEVGIPCCP